MPIGVHGQVIQIFQKWKTKKNTF